MEKRKVVKIAPRTDDAAKTTTGGASKQATTSANSSTPTGKKYSELQVQELLADGYLNVHEQLWDLVPTGAHVRYIKKDTGGGLPRHERFKPGGFVREHIVTKEGKKMLMLETIPGGAKYPKPGREYISFAVAYEDISELWKKYDRFAFIEIYLIYNSLAQKKQQIESHETKIKELTERVTTLENILKSAVKK
jgi:hypothetical protein